MENAGAIAWRPINSKTPKMNKKPKLNPQQLVVIKAIFPEGSQLLLIGWKCNIYRDQL